MGLTVNPASKMINSMVQSIGRTYSTETTKKTGELVVKKMEELASAKKGRIGREGMTKISIVWGLTLGFLGTFWGNTVEVKLEKDHSKITRSSS